MDIASLQKILIFRGLNPKEIADALTVLSALERTYQKNDSIFHAGTLTRNLGLVLDGSVIIESNDIWGNRTILSHVGKGEFFAETYALLENEPMLVDVTANEKCLILFIRLDLLLQRLSFPDPESWTLKIVKNLLTISAQKNLILSGRSLHISPKTIRGRVLTYLNSVSIQKGTKEFDIPFDRRQLADYLNLERTALSKELGKMQKEGILSVKKNHFQIHITQENKWS